MAASAKLNPGVRGRRRLRAFHRKNRQAKNGSCQCQLSACRRGSRKYPHVAGRANAAGWAMGAPVMPMTPMFCPSSPRFVLTTGKGGLCCHWARALGVSTPHSSERRSRGLKMRALLPLNSIAPRPKGPWGPCERSCKELPVIPNATSSKNVAPMAVEMRWGWVFTQFPARSPH